VGHLDVPEGDLQVASLGDLQCGSQPLLLADRGEHLLGRLEPEPLSEVHGVGRLVVDAPARLNAHQKLVEPGVTLVRVMRVVCRDDLEPGFLGQFELHRRDDSLLIQAVIHDLHVEIVGPEDLQERPEGGPASLLAPLQDGAVDGSPQAACEHDEALVALGQKLQIDARLAVEPLQVTCRHQREEVPVAREILRQEDDVVPLPIQHGVSAGTWPRSEVHLTPDDGLDAGLLARLIEGDRAEHGPVVGLRQSRHAVLLAPIQEVGYARGSVQHAVLGVAVQMHEAHGSQRSFHRVSVVGKGQSRWAARGGASAPAPHCCVSPTCARERPSSRPPGSGSG